MGFPYKKPVIVGGGVTGLALADLWSRRGMDCTLVEREPVLGGLSRSVQVDGLPYDLGPHRFFTHDPEVLDYILGVLGGNYDWIERKTSFYLSGRYHQWPITRQALWSLPWKESFRAGIDLLLRSHRPVDNFEDFIISRYGPTLNRIFFKPITDKFFRIPSKLVHPDWAVASVDRSIIDKYQHVDTLYYLLARLIKPPEPFHFIYPRQGGMQFFADELARRLDSCGHCRVITGTPAAEVETARGKVCSITLADGERIETDGVVWTAPVTKLWELVTGSPSTLNFLTTIFYYLMLDKAVTRPEQWIYFPEEEFRVVRISIQGNFYREGGDRFRAITAEVTAGEEERIITDPERGFSRVVDDLVKLGVITGPGRVTGHVTVVVPESYPVYSSSYRRDLESMLSELCALDNLYIVGRSGMFWYNNMDNCIKVGMEFDRWMQSIDELPSAEQKKAWVHEARSRY